MFHENITGHALTVYNRIKDKDEKARWREILIKPFLKLVGGYMNAGVVAHGLFVTNYIEKLGLKNGTEWLIEITGSRYESETPVSGRHYTHGFYPKDDSKKRRQISVEIRKIEEDLHKLNCGVVEYNRELKNEDGLLVKQVGLFLPHMRLPKTPDGLLRRDIEGAAIFLAYLLDNGLVAESEIPKTDVDEHGNPLKNIAFGPVILMMAKTPDIQTKIRSLRSDEHSCVKQ